MKGRQKVWSDMIRFGERPSSYTHSIHTDVQTSKISSPTKDGGSEHYSHHHTIKKKKAQKHSTAKVFSDCYQP